MRTLRAETVAAPDLAAARQLELWRFGRLERESAVGYRVPKLASCLQIADFPGHAPSFCTPHACLADQEQAERNHAQPDQPSPGASTTPEWVSSFGSSAQPSRRGPSGGDERASTEPVHGSRSRAGTVAVRRSAGPLSVADLADVADSASYATLPEAATSPRSAQIIPCYGRLGARPPASLVDGANEPPLWRCLREQREKVTRPGREIPICRHFQSRPRVYGGNLK